MVVFVLSLLLIITIPCKADLVFPLRTSRSVSSTFGDYRLSHSHAGIDIMTDTEGEEVLTAADGYVARIKVSYTGYGKVVYLQHSDGTTTIYGHLSRFIEPINQLVRKAQYDKGSYDVDFRPRPRSISIRAGEVLGYSGSTGTDLIHLHFEVRNASNVCLNPLAYGLKLKDTLPPFIEKIRLIPRSIGAEVEGLPFPAIYNFSTGTSERELPRPIRIVGRVGIEVEAYDQMDNSPRKLNPYSIKLEIDGKPFFFIKYDKITYAEAESKSLDFVNELKAKEDQRFHRLYQYAQPIRFYDANLAGDLSSLSKGLHSATIIIKDAAGNIGIGRFNIEIVEPVGKPISSQAIQEATDSLQKPDVHFYSDRIIIEFSNEALENIKINLEYSHQVNCIAPLAYIAKRTALVIPLPNKYFGEVHCRIQLANKVGTFSWQIQSAQNKAVVFSEDKLASAHFGSSNIYFPFPLEVVPAEVEVPQYLEKVGNAYRFSGEWEPLASKVNITVTTKRDLPSQTGLYHLDEKGIWWWMGANIEGRNISAFVPRLGTFTVLRDKEPPEIESINLKRNNGSLNLLSKITDKGSGVIPKTIKMSLDGKTIFPEWNPYSGILSVEISPLPAKAQHTVSIQAIDRAGNASKKTFNFLYSD